MTYAPPSGISVYDVVYAIVSAIPSRIMVPTRAVGDILSRLLTNVFNWILKPIIDGVFFAISVIIESLGGMVNGIMQGIVNAIYTIIINPIKFLAVQMLNRLYERLEGVIFIAITVPAMILEIKSLMHKPSPKGFLLLALKPILGAIGAKLVAGLIKPALKPITFEPSIPPPIQLVPPPREVQIIPYDMIDVDDELTIEVSPPFAFRDTINVEDYVTLQALPPMSFLDFVGTEDYISLTIFPPLEFRDTVEVNDILDIEIIPPLALSDTVEVQDTLIIWGE